MLYTQLETGRKQRLEMDEDGTTDRPKTMAGDLQ